MARRTKTEVGEAKLYVICACGFEYNDEIYHRPESEGGKPVLASSDKAKAEKACQDMNFKEFCANFPELRNYFYEPSEHFTQEAIDLLQKNKVIVSETNQYRRDKHEQLRWEWDNDASWQNVPADDLMEIYKGCSLRWFEVYEVSDSV